MSLVCPGPPTKLGIPETATEGGFQEAFYQTHEPPQLISLDLVTAAVLQDFHWMTKFCILSRREGIDITANAPPELLQSPFEPQ